MESTNLIHPDVLREQFPEPLTVQPYKQGDAIVAYMSNDPKARDYLNAIEVPFREGADGWVGVDASDPRNLARLRIYGTHVPWIFDSYPFPGKFKPYEHQRGMFSSLIEGFVAAGRLFNLSEMATGKTAGTMWAIHALLKAGVIKSALILTPKSTIYDPWVTTAFDIAPEYNAIPLVGDSKKKRATLAESRTSIVITNHHTVNTLRNELAAKKFDIVVIDEATVAKSATAVIFKNTMAVTAGARMVVPLTGTPTANSLLDSHGLLLLGRVPGTPTSVTGFKRTYGFPSGPFTHTWFHTSEQEIVRRMFPSVMYRKRECIDLPPQIDIFRQVDMAPEQKRAYQQMVDDYMYELQHSSEEGTAVHTVTAVNAISLMTKLLQIAGGVVWGLDDNGKAVQVVTEPKDKLDELFTAIDQTDRKVLVFASYKPTIAHLHKALEKRYGAGVVESVTGETSTKQRGEIIATFQDPESLLQVVVAHPQVLALGVTMTAADVTIWWQPTTRTELYLQGRERISRPGQTADKTTQLHILCSDIERKIYSKQKDKIKTQEVMLTMFRDLTAKYKVNVQIAGTAEEVGDA